MLMYKLLLFLKKSDDEKIFIHFKEITLNLLSEIAGFEIKIAKVESSLLPDVKYDYCCELSAESKYEMDKKMNSRAGRQLMRDLADYHQNFITIFINYGG